MITARGRCRAGCGEPLADVLVDRDGEGIHACCIAPPMPMLPELHAILGRHQAGSDRSQQKRIGPSEIGLECDRQLAYRLFGPARHKDETLRWAPLVGTWGHAGIASALAQENAAIGRNRYLIEQRVEVAPELGISGVTDCFDTDRSEVVDWKFVGKTRMMHYRRRGPGSVYHIQAHLYGRGWVNAGLEPRSVRIVFLPRWSHDLNDGWEWCEPYQPAVADEALERLVRVRDLGDALGLSATGGPWSIVAAQVGEWCRFCPWRRPGGEADASGCPGDTEELRVKAVQSFAKGLIG